jgi:maleate cis-trans isomerase
LAFTSWRGVVGLVKPTHRPGSLEEFIRLLPEGIGVVPLYLNFQRGTEEEFRGALEAVHKKVEELAHEAVDLIHPEGAPPFMVHGFEGEAKIISDWEQQYKIPIVTAAQTQVEALRTLGIKKFVGVTYFTGSINEMFTRYFQQAGFEVLAMEGIEVAFADVGRLSSLEIYAHTRKAFLKHQNADGIYMLGTGWRCLDIIRLLEQDLQVPVVHPVPARVWSIQKRLHVRQRVKSFGRLLEEMP